MTAVLSVLLGLVVVVAITAVTGYFVAQEFAYMAVDRSRLAALSASGDAAAGRALKVTKRTSFMLSGAQLGITVTGLLVGYVAEPLIGTALAEMLGWASVPSGVGIAIGTVLALLVSTIIQMLFGELVPKNLAIARPGPVAKALSRSTLIYLKMFGWVVWLFDQTRSLMRPVLHLDADTRVYTALKDMRQTRNHLAVVVESGRVLGVVTLADLLRRLFPEADVVATA